MFLSLLDYYFCKMFKKPKVRNTSSLFRACQFPLCKRNGGSESLARSLRSRLLSCANNSPSQWSLDLTRILIRLPMPTKP